MIANKIHGLLKWVAGLSVIGMADAAYLTYLHFEPDASDFCNFSEKWNCDIVNKSIYSTLNIGPVEIPVAILGFCAFLLIGVVSLGVVKKFRFQKIQKSLRDGVVLKLLRYFSIIAFLFSLYLTYVEAFKLMTFCLFCVISQTTILLIMLLFFRMNHIIKNNKKDAKACEFC